MSTLGEAIKNSGAIREAVKRISNSDITGKDGVIRGTKKTLGYVCAINEEGDLAGTINVQEFIDDPSDYDVPGVGFHEGVRLSAIQNNQLGYLIVPMLFSEVIICKSPLDGLEYVLMYSQAKRIQLTTQSLKSEDDGEVRIGVTEVEDFVEDSKEGGQEKDFNELEPTKNQTSTIYSSKSITHQIISPEDEKGLTEEATAANKTIAVGDTKITIDGNNVSIETSSQVTFKVGGTTITHENGKVNIETNECVVKGSNVEINGSQVKITGGTLTTQGQSSVDMNGPFNAIKACPFSGAPHCGSIVSGT